MNFEGNLKLWVQGKEVCQQITNRGKKIEKNQLNGLKNDQNRIKLCISVSKLLYEI